MFSLLVTDKKDIPPPFVLGKGINILLAEICLQNHFPTPFILSAERLGISLFYKELDIRRNVLVEKLQKMSHGNGKDKEVFDPFELIEEFSARFAVPIRDNISFTRSIDILQKKQCLLKNGKVLADKIKDMMGGGTISIQEWIYALFPRREKTENLTYPCTWPHPPPGPCLIFIFF